MLALPKQSLSLTRTFRDGDRDRSGNKGWREGERGGGERVIKGAKPKYNLEPDSAVVFITPRTGNFPD